MSDFENQKTIDGNIYHCEAECSLESKENENPSDLDFFCTDSPKAQLYRTAQRC